LEQVGDKKKIYLNRYLRAAQVSLVLKPPSQQEEGALKPLTSVDYV
jgi:hypothetical protein